MFAEVRFPAGSLLGLNGTAFNTGDSVRVTLQAAGGSYGLSVSPAGLELAPGATATVRFAFARYGDFSVAGDSPTYASSTEYAAALEIWEETTIDRWRVAQGSGPTGTDAVSASFTSPGTFLVAARR